MREPLYAAVCGGLTALYRKDETGTVELLLVPTGMEHAACRADCAAEPLVQLKCAEDDAPAFFSGGRTMRNSLGTRALRYREQTVERTGEGVNIVTTLEEARSLRAVHTLRLFENSPAAEVSVTVRNIGDSPVTLEMLSSFTLGSLSPFAEGLAPETLTLHRLRSTWSGEGRLVSEPAEDLQLEPSWKQYSANSLRFGSVGSFPVRGYVPFCAVEDTAHGVTWVAATTQASSWQMELYRQDFGLSLSGGLADRELGHWCKTLAPGEEFAVPPALLTAVRGGVDEAAQALTADIRRHVKIPDADADMPVIFNEFCTTWGVPTEETVLRQVEFLKGRGVGTYVIDAGWYDDAATESASRLGSWQVSRKAFPHGLCPVVDAIHDAGMKAGIWFEFEVAGRDDAVCFQKLDWLLHRDGRPITAGDRRFWDMRKPEVQEYLAEKVIAFLRDNRFDYMKVDYNETIGIGCDGAESLGEGLRQQIGATQAFFARIQRELPELVIELCSSGGHRLVHSFLNLCPMASFSDAHECDEIPIIAANMHRILLPRQSQIWAVVHPEHTLQKLYYQICSGLLGRLCYSGDIFALREEQWQVMQAGCDFYARAAPVIAEGFSKRYGPKIASYRYPRGWQAVVRRGKNQTLTVLHTFHEAPDRVELPDIGSNPQLFARSGIALDGKTVCGLTDFDGVAILTENED